MLLIGETTVFLPMLHHTLLLYSQNIANEIMQKGYRLLSCTDQRFVESVFKLVRREFKQKPVLTVTQFLRKGFESFANNGFRIDSLGWPKKPPRGSTLTRLHSDFE